MKRIFFYLVSFFTLLALQEKAESKILVGDRINIDKPARAETLTLGDEIIISQPLLKEFIGIGRKMSASTDSYRDFIGAGIRIDFSGRARKDLFLVGNSILAEGRGDGNMTAFGKNLRLKMSLGGNIRASAETINLDGNIKGKTALWGKDIYIKGKYGGDMVIYGNNISFDPDTVIKGDLSYSSPEEKDLSHIRVSGIISWNKPFTDRIKEKAPVEKLKKLYLFFSLLFPVLLMLWLFPNLFKQTTYISGHNFIKCFMGGLALIIPTLLAIPIIFITIVGAPLGLIVTSSFLSLIYVSRVFPAIYIGSLIFGRMKKGNLPWVMAAFTGTLLFTAVSLNPTARLFLNLLSIPAGFGAIFMGRIKLVKRLRKEGIL